MMKQRWGLDRNVLRPTPGDPWGVEQHHWNTGAEENQQLNPGGPSNRQKTNKSAFEPRQANLCLRAFRHDKFQLRMPSHSEGIWIWLSVWRFLLTHCLYERAAKVLARLRGCAGSPEPLLLAYAISTKFAWRGPFEVIEHKLHEKYQLKCEGKTWCRQFLLKLRLIFRTDVIFKSNCI